MTEKYGNRNVPKMIRQVEQLRAAIRAEGTPAIQEAWDLVEEHIDYAYRADIPPTLAEALAVPEVRAMRQALMFLTDRLQEFELDETDAPGMVREFIGHVVPAGERAMRILADIPAEGD